MNWTFITLRPSNFAQFTNNLLTDLTHLQQTFFFSSFYKELPNIFALDYDIISPIVIMATWARGNSYLVCPPRYQDSWSSSAEE